MSRSTNACYYRVQLQHVATEMMTSLLLMTKMALLRLPRPVTVHCDCDLTFTASTTRWVASRKRRTSSYTQSKKVNAACRHDMWMTDPTRPHTRAHTHNAYTCTTQKQILFHCCLAHNSGSSADCVCWRRVAGVPGRENVTCQHVHVTC